MLNALTYGWWTNKNLYIADPDHVVLGDKADQGARNVIEGKSRLLSAVISGGMILDSSRVADDPESQLLAKAVYDNRNLFAVASEGKAFRPIEGDTGNKAAAVFARPSPNGTYIAVFNYEDKKSQTIHVPLDRLGPALSAAHTVSVKDVASGILLAPGHGEITIELQPAESKLMEVQQVN